VLPLDPRQHRPPLAIDRHRPDALAPYIDTLERLAQTQQQTPRHNVPDSTRRYKPDTPGEYSAGELLLQHPLQKFDLLAEIAVILHHLLDLAHRMQHGRMVAPAEASPDFGERTRGHRLREIHRDLARPHHVA